MATSPGGLTVRDGTADTDSERLRRGDVVPSPLLAHPMGGVSPDGKVMWWSGRYNGVVYAMSTRNGRLLAKIPAGAGPHGVCVFPQPGRYSLGHTGNFR